MDNSKSIIYGSILTIVAILMVVVYALYNEGLLTKNTYTNTLFGYELTVPRGYQLGLVYMEYMNNINSSLVRIGSSTNFISEEAEVVVLTRQDKSKQEKSVEWLKQNPMLSLEQLCECVVLIPSLLPKPMSELVNKRNVKDGISGTTTPIVGVDGELLTVYTNKLGEFYLDYQNQLRQKATGQQREKVDLFFTEPKSFPLDNDYLDDYEITIYGLTLSRFTSETQTATLQDIVSTIQL